MKTPIEKIIAIFCIFFGIFLGIYFYNEFGITYAFVGAIFGLIAPLILARFTRRILLKMFPNLGKGN